ncbi:MAG TPA: hypothetical protein VHS96_18270, partial [Bacteroidia bacterium]|nr:hypothetical protein [Bacteroidia bacterium]
MRKKIDPSSSKSKFRLWAARRPRLVLLLVNMVGITLVLVIVELVLRAWGLAPGYLDMGHADFKPLAKGQQLQVSEEFYTDSLGIYRAFPDSFVNRGFPVNSWGFRGPEFDLQDSSRKRVMLIGDSFTWGANAKPMDSCYADLLRGLGHQVFNFGIPGTDPDQYERIAELYIPQVNPDMVCLFFYMNNDIMRYPKAVVPNGNIYHITNVGWLNAYLDGDYIGGPEETYAYFKQRFNVPPTNAFNRLCAKTVIGTRAWQVLNRLEWVDGKRPAAIQARMDASEEARKHGPYAGRHLRVVARICASRGIPFRMFVIPGHDAIQRPDTAAMPGLFVGLPYHYPEGLVSADYFGRPDGHFNNSGHRKMAQTVTREIEK